MCSSENVLANLSSDQHTHLGCREGKGKRNLSVCPLKPSSLDARKAGARSTQYWPVCDWGREGLQNCHLQDVCLPVRGC